MSMLSSIPVPDLHSYPKLNPRFGRLRPSSGRSLCVANTSGGRNPPLDLLRQIAASSAIFFLGFGFSIRTHSASAICTPQIPPVQTVVENQEFPDNDCLVKSKDLKNFEDKEMQDAFESWKSKTYSLTVPLRIIALRGSIPPLWVKDFLRSQGKRVRLLTEFRGSVEDIYSELLMPFMKGNVHRKSALASDLVTVSDSWLSLAIRNALIEPMKGIEEQDWYQGLSDKWKIKCELGEAPFLRHTNFYRTFKVGYNVPSMGIGGMLSGQVEKLNKARHRNNDGILDSKGRIWAIPYRWGSMVIAYKKSKFQKHNLAPIEDWADLWRPELAGKIAMVNSPREVVGAVLKYMGASYNTSNIDSQVAGGRNAVRRNLALLEKQVRLFDSVHYLKAFGVGDVWVAVGWSSDVLPAAIRMSNVAVVVPKSGASLWVDLWAIPAASRFATEQIGGRVRGPSPLVDQWIDFCLQPQRELPFKQMVVAGTSPPALGRTQIEDSKWMGEGNPKLDTNLIAGVPPSEILARCEFLEPLSDVALEDYGWLISSMQKPPHTLIQTFQSYVLSAIQTFWPKLPSKFA